MEKAWRLGTAMSAFDELLAYCFEGRHPAFEAEFAGWLRVSRRLRAFVEENRSKIRAKLKSARDEPGLLDVRAELAAAAALLGDERFALTYEAYAAGKRGGPDFTATFRTHTRFNIEVRRLHGNEARASSAEGGATGENGSESSAEEDSASGASNAGSAGGVSKAKLIVVLGDKVRQMPPGSVNFVWLAAEGGVAVEDVAAAALALRQRAEGKDHAFFTRRGFADAGTFLKQYGQMSGVLLWQEDAVALWPNPLARHKPPAELVLALRRLRSGSPK